MTYTGFLLVFAPPAVSFDYSDLREAGRILCSLTDTLDSFGSICARKAGENPLNRISTKGIAKEPFMFLLETLHNYLRVGRNREGGNPMSTLKCPRTSAASLHVVKKRSRRMRVFKPNRMQPLHQFQIPKWEVASTSQMNRLPTGNRNLPSLVYEAIALQQDGLCTLHDK